MEKSRLKTKDEIIKNICIYMLALLIYIYKDEENTEIYESFLKDFKTLCKDDWETELTKYVSYTKGEEYIEIIYSNNRMITFPKQLMIELLQSIHLEKYKDLRKKDLAILSKSPEMLREIETIDKNIYGTDVYNNINYIKYMEVY